MLIAIQLVALIQGLFLMGVLFVKRDSYKKPTLWLLIGSILSIIFFILGDDDNNMIAKGVDWFFFDASLFITFLFLFVKYSVSGREIFNKLDLLYFVPNIAYFINEIYEVTAAFEEVLAVEIFELIIELSFLYYLVHSMVRLFQSKKQKWMLIFMIPLALLMSASMVNEVLGWFGLTEIELFNDANFNTFTLLTVALLFYFITMKLILAPKEVLLALKEEKYKSSGLNEKMVAGYKNKIISFMEMEKGYTDPKLSLTTMSQNLNIPKQYISEILSIHLNTNFQDFVNGYRVEAFENCVQKEQYAHLTLMGIANEVGFNSKSNFYTTYKKIKGLTPYEYKKSLSSNNE